MKTTNELREELTMARQRRHEADMRKAKYGIAADPHMIIEAEEAAKEVARLERLLGIVHPAPPPEPPPRPIASAWDERRYVEQQQSASRQRDIEHYMNLLGIHRRNLAHYRAQARIHGGIEYAPPITRHGLNEGRAGIAQAKAALRQLGVEVDDLPGDE